MDTTERRGEAIAGFSSDLSLDTVTLKINGKSISVKKGSLLSDSLGMEKPCGGKGACGKCKVIARGALSAPSAAEARLLTHAELKEGIRLACLSQILGDCEVITQEKGKESILINGVGREIPLAPRFEKYGAAIDIGTTTLAARLFDSKGHALAEASAVNPQEKWGADVISRIEADGKGQGAELSRAVKDAVIALLSSLAVDAAISLGEIDGLVLTGNTAMLHLFTSTPTEPLSHAPFLPSELFGKCVTAGALGLSALSAGAEIYLPPCISAFLGADTVCAMLAADLSGAKSPALLVDIGTNGEIVLNDSGKLFATSTAAGPAFEGVGISCGMRGQAGAIDAVHIVNGAPTPHVKGGGAAKGICGSGLIDAVACLLTLGELDSIGYLDSPAAIAKGVLLTQEDIRSLQLAKAAIRAGMETLLALQGVKPHDLSRIFIAGGFGSFLNFKNAERIGLLPSGATQKATAIGNAALAGASMLLLNRPLANSADALAKSTTAINLATETTFAEKYTEGMLFPDPHP